MDDCSCLLNILEDEALLVALQDWIHVLVINYRIHLARLQLSDSHVGSFKFFHVVQPLLNQRRLERFNPETSHLFQSGHLSFILPLFSLKVDLIASLLLDEPLFELLESKPKVKLPRCNIVVAIQRLFIPIGHHLVDSISGYDVLRCFLLLQLINLNFKVENIPSQVVVDIVY